MKFNKDTFIRDVTTRVQNAIDKGVISQESDNGGTKSLEGFVQYVLLDYVKDRTFAVDVLRNISIDDRKTIHEWENEFGEIKSLLDIALIDLFLFLKSSDVLTYETYSHDKIQTDEPMLDAIHAIDDEENINSDDYDEYADLDLDDNNNHDNSLQFDDHDQNLDFNLPDDNMDTNLEKPKRKVRFVKESTKNR